MLVIHVWFVLFALCGLLVSKRVAEWAVDVSVLGASLLFLVGVTVLTVQYSAVYSRMYLFYLIFGVGAAVLYLPVRFQLTNSSTVSKRTAIVESAVILLVIIAAIFSQCELIGRKYHYSTSPYEYDFWHGNWHYLLATATSIVYTRAADSGPVIEGSVESCICSTPRLDAFGLGVVVLYAACTLAFKEAAIPLQTSKAILGTLCAMLGIHAASTAAAFLPLFRDKTISLISRH